jgi:type II restriction enzyme
MPTDKQILGKLGEKLVTKRIPCPGCKKSNTLQPLIQNFKCLDIICDFCGYVAQVKTNKVKDINKIPNKILGGAWGPFKERMMSGRFFHLFIVLVDENSPSKFAIYYLPADLQKPEIFTERKPLSPTARRAGWIGTDYNLSLVKNMIAKLM